jgi:hypothetical protein
MGAALGIRSDLASPARPRRLARRERNPRTAARMLASTGALEGRSRAEAARLPGMERQALRDAAVRYNAEGPEGLRDRPKPGRPPALTDAEAHPGKRIEVWFEDGCRIGEKGRTGHRWWVRGERPRGPRQIGYEWAFLFGAVRPATGQGFALAPPEVSTAATRAFLDGFAAGLAAGAHAVLVLVLDQAGWHGARGLVVPTNVILVPPPPYAPEFNPVERVWLFLRERFLFHRVLDGYGAVVEACCEAWNALTPERLRSLCAYPWVMKVAS